jgi:PAS domain S-box-containing protein
VGDLKGSSPRKNFELTILGAIMVNTIETCLEKEGTSLELLKVLAENSFDSILVTDATLEGKVIYANKAFEILTGHDPLEVIGQTPRILQGAGTDQKVIGRLTDAMKSGNNFEGKAINYKKDGTPFIMYWRVLPIKIDESIEAWVAIQREGSSI